MYIGGVILGCYNLWKTCKVGKFIGDETVVVPKLQKNEPVHGNTHWHRWIERRPIQLSVLALIMILIGGLIEMVPTFLIKSNVPTISSVQPYTAGATRARYLHPRGLRELPHADGEAISLRNGTIWRILQGGGICLRSPVSLGIKTHRS